MGRRVIHVSNWFYGIVESGAKYYGISKTAFFDKFLNAFLGREKINFKAFLEKEGKGTVEMANKTKGTSIEMSNRELIKYSFQLMKEIDSEKAEKLRERLNSIDPTFLTEKKEKVPVLN